MSVEHSAYPMETRFICEGVKGRLFEVTREREVVWEYISPFFVDGAAGRVNQIFRTYRYGPNFLGFREKTLDPERHAWLNHLIH